MEFEEIVNGFAEKFGVDGLAPDENGTVRLEIDGMGVDILYDMAERTAFLCAEIGEPPPEGRERFAEVLLRANFLFQGTDGATLAQNPETKAYALVRPLNLAGLDIDILSERLGAFVNGVERWRQTLTDFRDVAETVPETEVEAVSPFDSHGFLTV